MAIASASALSMVLSLQTAGGAASAGQDVSPQAAGAEELVVPNAGFEAQNDDGSPSEWTLVERGTDTLAAVTREKVFTGTGSLEISHLSAPRVRLRSTLIPTEASHRHTVSAQVFTDQTYRPGPYEPEPASLLLEFWDENGKLLDWDHVQPASIGEWRRAEIADSVSPDGTASVSIQVQGHFASAGTSYFDDVALTRTPVAVGARDPDIGHAKQLFFDDEHIEHRTGVSRVTHEARTTTEPVIEADKPWEEGNAYVFGSVIYDEAEHIYKAWYQSYSRSLGKYLVLYATSEDGLEWSKPALGRFEYGGSTDNNILMEGAMASVIKDVVDPDPGRRYKMTLHRYQDEHSYRAMVSADGIDWRLVGDERILPAGDTISTFYDSETDRYVTFWKPRRVFYGGWDRRTANVAVSKDFEEWTQLGAAVYADELDDQLSHEAGYGHGQVYSMTGARYEGWYIGFPSIFNTPDSREGPIDVQFAYSRDLRTWVREDRRAIIPRGEPGEWDAGMLFAASEPIVVGNEIWLYYGAWDGTHGVSVSVREAGIGIARWRRDGFISLRNDGTEAGAITTKPIVFDGNRLVINADAEGGSLEVELLDADGEPLPGFERDRSRVFSGDSVSHEVTWDGTSAARLRALAGTDVRIRFHLTDGDLYAYQFVDALVPSECAEPDDGATVVVGAQDSGVPNRAINATCTIDDAIDDEAQWADHGRFVRHVVEVTDELRSKGLLSVREAGAIVRAAARSAVGRDL